MPTLVERRYAAQDMQCPGAYYGGFKEARVLSFGEARRQLSHPTTGDWIGSDITLTLSDSDKTLRQLLASPTNRFWTTDPCDVRMVTRQDRANMQPALPVFVGHVVNVKPSGQLKLDVTLRDHVGRGLINDEFLAPWRRVGDSPILETLDTVNPNLDRDMGEPIVYGERARDPNDLAPPVPSGMPVTPIYLGIVGGEYVWMIAGHAIHGGLDVLIQAESGQWASAYDSSNWRIAGLDGAPKYEDFTGGTYGNTRRYALMYATVGTVDADSVIEGQRPIVVMCNGVESAGTGAGTLITDRFQQYEHFLINYVANKGPNSYHTGAYLSNPEHDIEDGPYPIVLESSFTAATTIGLARLPPDGYQGAAVIGGYAGRQSVKRWIAEWNRSCGCRFGVNRYGQMMITLLHPTDAAKAAAPLITDAYEMIQGSFDVEMRWEDQANRIPFQTDRNDQTGAFLTNDIASWDDAIANYGREIIGHPREYLFAPGITLAYHLARLDVLTHKDPPRIISFTCLMEGREDVEIETLELGDYIRYQAYGAVGSAGEIRLAQIEAITVAPGACLMRFEARDCEEQINFALAEDIDAPGVMATQQATRFAPNPIWQPVG